jgi:hypothetical protein
MDVMKMVLHVLIVVLVFVVFVKPKEFDFVSFSPDLVGVSLDVAFAVIVAFTWFVALRLPAFLRLF